MLGAIARPVAGANNGTVVVDGKTMRCSFDQATGLVGASLAQRLHKWRPERRLSFKQR
jgi:hypothetical protein